MKIALYTALLVQNNGNLDAFTIKTVWQKQRQEQTKALIA